MRLGAMGFDDAVVTLECASPECLARTIHETDGWSLAL